jgi:hypothetical protein
MVRRLARYEVDAPLSDLYNPQGVIYLELTEGMFWNPRTLFTGRTEDLGAWNIYLDDQDLAVPYGADGYLGITYQGGQSWGYEPVSGPGGLMIKTRICLRSVPVIGWGALDRFGGTIASAEGNIIISGAFGHRTSEININTFSGNPATAFLFFEGVYSPVLKYGGGIWDLNTGDPNITNTHWYIYRSVGGAFDGTYHHVNIKTTSKYDEVEATVMAFGVAPDAEHGTRLVPLDIDGKLATVTLGSNTKKKISLTTLMRAYLTAIRRPIYGISLIPVPPALKSLTQDVTPEAFAQGGEDLCRKLREAMFEQSMTYIGQHEIDGQMSRVYHGSMTAKALYWTGFALSDEDFEIETMPFTGAVPPLYPNMA